MVKFLHIDGDIVRYRAGFAAETSYWRAVRFKDGEVVEVGDRLAFKSEVKEMEEGWEAVYDPDPEPLENCLHSVKMILEAIVDSCKVDWLRARVYLSSPGDTFRHKLATIRPYKGTRDPSHRPHWMNEITTYIDENYNVRWSQEGLEADDSIGIAHTAFGKGSCIASIDKDLDTIPGWHYNFVQDRKYNVTHEEAMRNYFIQLLVGDTSDNVQGCPGVGEIGAKKLLAAKYDEQEYWGIVWRAYKRAYNKLVFKDGTDPDKEALSALIENAKLLWILHEPGDTPPLPEYWEKL